MTVNGACMQPWFGVGWSMSAIASKYPGSMVHMRDAPNAPHPRAMPMRAFRIGDWATTLDVNSGDAPPNGPNTCPLEVPHNRISSPSMGSRGKESALRACRRGPVHLFMGTAVRADRRAAALNLTD